MIKSSRKAWYASKIFSACAVAAAAVFCSGAAYGQGYTTTFDNLTKNSSLSGQDSWDTNDLDNGVTTTTSGGTQSVGQSDFVGIISGYSAANPAGGNSIDNWAYLGGLNHDAEVPGSTQVFLYRPFTLPATTAFAFNVDMGISSSSTYPDRDGFGWTFRNASGTTLFSVNFDPVAGTGNPFAIRTANALGTEMSTGAGILSDSKYHLTVSVSAAGLVSIVLTPTNGTATTIASNILVAGIGTTAQVAATWTLGAASTATSDNGGYINAGGNSLIFNNYSVAVPEPTTWAAFGVGIGLTMLAARRRARA